ncbi:glycosyltransferase [uncultured Megasphaera sp.]|uniref:glycosyltransferase n=1 Tax=uncultured Megasphaera sp. TaxID=165188 RepID=UPI0025E97271|nr:glycosyltransferase [uncultured Megasphaera sp.]
MLSLVTVNYNDSDTVIDYVNRILSFRSIDNIIIVDNKSTDDSFKHLFQNYTGTKKVSVIQSGRNGGYGFGNNIGVKYAIDHFNSDYVLISNADVEYKNSTISKLLIFMKQEPELAVISPQMLDINKIPVSNCAWKIPNKKQAFIAAVVGIKKDTGLLYDFDKKTSLKYVDCVAGSLLLVRSKAFQEIGGYDENMFLFCEETLLGIRMKHFDWKSAIDQEEYFIHAHSVSIKKTYKSKKKRDLLTWKSRKYILQNYYACTKFELMIMDILVKCHIELSAFKHWIIK